MTFGSRLFEPASLWAEKWCSDVGGR